MREKTKRQREKEIERHHERERERENEAAEAERRERIGGYVVEAENSLFERPSGNRRYTRLCVCR